GDDAAEADREAVSAEVPELQLVLVPRAGEDLDLGVLEAGELRRVAELKARRLAGDGLRVLHAGVAGVALPDTERPGEPRVRRGRRAPPLLEGDVEVLALAAGRVERDLLDDEVLGDESGLARDRGEIGGGVTPRELGGQADRGEARRALVFFLVGHGR